MFNRESAGMDWSDRNSTPTINCAQGLTEADEVPYAPQAAPCVGMRESGGNENATISQHIAVSGRSQDERRLKLCPSAPCTSSRSPRSPLLPRSEQAPSSSCNRCENCCGSTKSLPCPALSPPPPFLCARTWLWFLARINCLNSCITPLPRAPANTDMSFFFSNPARACDCAARQTHS